MIRTALPLVVLATAAAAEPRFEDLSDTLPDHAYTGPWEHFVGGGLTAFDCNGDRLPELLAAGGTNPMLFLSNDGDMAFSPARFPQITGATGAYPVDANADGNLDLYILRAGRDRLLAGLGDCRFVDVSDAVGLPRGDRWSTAFTAWWLPGAAAPTLAVGHYVDRVNPDGPFGACDDNRLLEPAPVTADSPGAPLAFGTGLSYRARDLTPGYCPLSLLAARDARDRLTLRLSNDRHYYGPEGGEQLWDIEDGRFLDETDGWEEPKLWGMGIASADLTGDGRDEVMLSSMGDQVLTIATEDGSYRIAPYEMGVTAQRPFIGDDTRPSTGWHTAFGDVDLDGDLDLFIAKGNVDSMEEAAAEDPNNLLLQGADGTFTEVADVAGVALVARSRGAALIDLDGDGDLDLAVNNRRDPLALYRNVTETSGAWVALDPRLPGPNRFGLGTVVEVRTEAGVQSRQRTVGGGHAGGGFGPLHFGLGDVSAAEARLRLPDGAWTEWRDVPLGAVTVLTP